jgi:hypothetical protein
MLKDGSIQPLDWEAYSLMRATSKMVVGSGTIDLKVGQSLRTETDLFKSRESYHNKNI